MLSQSLCVVADRVYSPVKVSEKMRLLTDLVCGAWGKNRVGLISTSITESLKPSLRGRYNYHLSSVAEECGALRGQWVASMTHYSQADSRISNSRWLIAERIPILLSYQHLHVPSRMLKDALSIGPFFPTPPLRFSNPITVVPFRAKRLPQAL